MSPPQSPQSRIGEAEGARASTHSREIILALLLCALLALLLIVHREPDALQQIQARGVLRVSSQIGLLSYVPGPQGPRGFEYDLSKAFARDLGVQLEITTRFEGPQIVPALRTGQVDIAASGLIRDSQSPELLHWGPGYREVHYQLIYRQGHRRPARLSDLGNGPVDTAGGPLISEIRERLTQDYPDLNWVIHKDLDAAALMDLVWQDVVDYALVRSDAVALYQRFYPEIRIAFDVGGPYPVSWALGDTRNGGLSDALKVFFTRIRKDGRLDQIRDRYFGHLGALDYVSVRRFVRHIYARLPRYRETIEHAARQSGLDWRLLAAMAYQESHWNPGAVSPTGVRGLMMLTQATANQLGIVDRLDPDGSIRGGARYFRLVLDKIPQRIAEPDRTWLALAAYNVGFGHLEDARILTQGSGGDPDKWIDVKSHLPLLRKKKWYKKTRHGYARGDEPVRYVARIRNFYDILAWETGAIPGPQPPPHPRAFEILPEAL